MRISDKELLEYIADANYLRGNLYLTDEQEWDAEQHNIYRVAELAAEILELRNQLRGD